MKQIKISDTVYEELSNQKYREESFDNTLKRKLGLLPEDIDQLTTGIPKRLETAIDTIVDNSIEDLDDIKSIGDQDDNKQALYFISEDTGRLIFEVMVYQPKGNERINHRVDIQYQNQSGESERILQLRDIEEGAIDIEYKDKETHEILENTRKGDTPGERTADDFGAHVSEFIQQAYKQWGKN